MSKQSTQRDNGMSQSFTGILPVTTQKVGDLLVQNNTLDLFFDDHAETLITERNLPHWRQDGKLYFVTWRLADSLPKVKRDQLEHDREEWQRHYGAKHHRELTPEQRRRYFELFNQRVQKWLDAGYGSCALRQAGPQRIMVDALHHFNGIRYTLGTFAVAPNHVHVLVMPFNGVDLSGILHSWKSFTAKSINKELGRTGKFWIDESYDHLVRNEVELKRIEGYIARHALSGSYVERHTVL